ncbi:MerR family transcriptional regulator [Ruminococcus gauvreauii]|uniref:MerR family transcriptional regulator n=1 Tax=Ruminococcus gauvreauii TaxID=438033 RepID=A0ABY5VID0_9FIRM|nr:MerR family transcriptional regulator [Ruminococcus gauvreauii]UWP60339.1 MerR family transcriptional regulator [Ruminococcus gauvreauii]
MEYSIKELSKMAGVSARTLRYYDEIGLLKPLRTSDAGYRFYGPGELDLLQQILFYRQRGFCLEKIADVLYNHDFDVMRALNEHLEDLKRQRMSIESVISAVERTIASMKGEITMSDHEKFEVLKQDMVEKNEKEYGREVRERYGDQQVNEYNRKMLQMTPEDYEQFQKLEQEITDGLKEAVREGAGYDSEKGRRIVLLHREWIEMTTPGYTSQMHKGLAEMYVADERFCMYYDKEIPGCAEFLKNAIVHWA